MDRSEETWPTNPDALLARAKELSDTITELKGRLQLSELENAKLKQIVARLKRIGFGHSSERHAGQFAFDLDVSGEPDAPSPPEPLAAVANDDDGKRHPVRRPLPDHLPREIIRHEPAGIVHGANGGHGCPRCGGRLHAIGEDHSEILDYVPGRFRVIRHVRPRLACRGCEAVVQAAAPSSPIERGLPGPGLLAQVLVSKYCDHVPLYRQACIYARSGVEVDRGTMMGWVGKAAWLLRPLAERIGRHVFAAAKIHADDTPLPVLAPGTGRTATGRIWVYVRDDRTSADATPPAAAFFYSPDRKGARPAAHLKGFSGFLQADAYAGYDRLYEGGRIVEVGCWAHARRKVFDVFASTRSPIAEEALAWIKRLYAIEARIRGRPPDLRHAVRQAEAAPLLVGFRDWLIAQRAKLPPRGGLSLAFGYILGHWEALIRYTSDGRLEADNNTAENVLRGIALGRKNFLFAGSDAGGENAAILYTLIETAKLNGIEPYAYLSDVVARIAEHPINRIDALLPWQWAEGRIAAWRQSAA
jgi:transposase